MAELTSFDISSFPAVAIGTAEEKANALVHQLDVLNPTPPDKISDDTVAITLPFGQLWDMVGGSLISGAKPSLDPKTPIHIRPYMDDDALTRAKVNRTRFPNTIFINMAHVRDQNLIAKLRVGYREAADGVLLRNECPPELLFAFHVYLSLDGFSGARTSYAQTLEEELLHLLSGEDDISKKAQLRRLVQDKNALPDALPLLEQSLYKSKEERDRPEGEKPYQRFQRRVRYLGDDWEFIARLGKLCRAMGTIPQTREEIAAFIKDIPLLLDGQKGLRVRSSSLWEASRIGEGKHFFRPLAEINALILILYPNGASTYFKDKALPYYFGILRTLHGDKDAMLRLGFKPVEKPVRGKKTGQVLKQRRVWVPDV